MKVEFTFILILSLKFIIDCNITFLSLGDKDPPIPWGNFPRATQPGKLTITGLEIQSIFGLNNTY